MFYSSISYLTDHSLQGPFGTAILFCDGHLQWSCYRRRTLGATVLFCDGLSGLSTLDDGFRHGVLLMVSPCFHTSLMLLSQPHHPAFTKSSQCFHLAFTPHHTVPSFDFPLKTHKTILQKLHNLYSPRAIGLFSSMILLGGHVPRYQIQWEVQICIKPRPLCRDVVVMC
ncbi:uncharacterized protein BDZ99DRAFT_251831 [Mytilinidion resinicola]|uniref:Uncharacterized protein n=1 Tax=Mytilinidion resinicola TaxID=574789 RepID=A0A6A6YXE0_9PEZI|nr:uncharacterized protein BDZ99DRAFT_251831 [Mytilinidion resinicola]KAF2813228.1 hypothetical protein BDZ99DRAFT_251831 [Mytilinidion resinicola]